MLDIGLVTCEKLPLLDPDSQLLETKLKEMGLKVAPVIWTDPAVAWDQMKLCLVRSTWDYHQKLSEFMIWAKRVALKTQLWNPIEIIMPNTNKTYLKALSNQGIRIVETVWVNPHDGFHLPDLMNEKGWDEVVVKPTISACSLDTFRVNRDNLDALWPEIQALLPFKAFMVQPYLHKIETEGEVSLIYINRRFTHAVSKKPKSGDFRVQEEWGGMIERVEPSAQLMIESLKVLETFNPLPLYSRFDFVSDEQGRPCLIELEVTEPSLYLRYSPEALEIFSKAIVDKLALIKA